MKKKDSVWATEKEVADEKEKKIHKTNALTGTMRAVRIHQYGGIEQLIYEVAPIPKPAPDEILIRVNATAVNPVDWKIRAGHWKDRTKHKLPLIPGWDVAGTVIHTGTLVTRFNEGDRVIARLDILKNGAYAGYATAKTTIVAFAPHVPFSIAAGIPLASQTAWMGLFEIGTLKANQKILIHGASGGVGTFAVQFAKIAGAYVIATTSEENIGLVKSLGADEIIDYRKEDFSARLKDLDMVFDTVGGETQTRSWKTLRKNGTLVSTLSIVDESMALQYGVSGKTFMADSNGARLQEIAGLVDKGMLRVIIDSEFPLEDVKKAHELSESGKARGKIILRVYDNPKQESFD
jgi:NADPH:quinone reductase-like Zn-dependent oxidoreductase